MSQLHKHAIPSAIAERALINPAQYQQYYQQSVQDPEAFGVSMAKSWTGSNPIPKSKTPRSIRATSASVGLKTAR